MELGKGRAGFVQAHDGRVYLNSAAGDLVDLATGARIPFTHDRFKEKYYDTITFQGRKFISDGFCCDGNVYEIKDCQVVLNQELETFPWTFVEWRGLLLTGGGGCAGAKIYSLEDQWVEHPMSEALFGADRALNMVHMGVDSQDRLITLQDDGKIAAMDTSWDTIAVLPEMDIFSYWEAAQVGDTLFAVQSPSVFPGPQYFAVLQVNLSTGGYAEIAEIQGMKRGFFRDEGRLHLAARGYFNTPTENVWSIYSVGDTVRKIWEHEDPTITQAMVHKGKLLALHMDPETEQASYTLDDFAAGDLPMGDLDKLSHKRSIIITYNRVLGYPAGSHGPVTVYDRDKVGQEDFMFGDAFIGSLGGTIGHVYVYVGHPDTGKDEVVRTLDQALKTARASKAKLTIVGCSCEYGRKVAIAEELGADLIQSGCGGERTLGIIADEIIKGKR